jgi:hypothetical protein
MKAVISTAVAVMLLGAGVPSVSHAEKPVNWAAAGRTADPYKDLPGVKDPKQLPVDEKFKCRTATVYPYGLHDFFYRGLPQLGYVCEQNGIVSTSTRAPNWSYWQYNDRNR